MVTKVKNKNFWNETLLEDFNQEDWEALCDGCAKCCLHKLENEDDGEIYYTDVHCKFLNLNTCSCTDYKNRHINVNNCISFSSKDIKNMHWLPETCAYKLKYQKKNLPNWHYLICGNKQEIHQQKQSIKGMAEADTGQDLEEHILNYQI